jgi:hypothetical protein
VQPPENPPGPTGPPPAAAPVPAPGSTAVPEPQEPPAPVSGAVEAPAPPVTGKQPNRRLRLWLAMGAGIIALLCLGGVGVVVSLYDSATGIKRTSPDAVVDGFLRAYLVDRDDKDAALYECTSGPDLTSLAALRNELVNRERQFAVKVNVSWSTLTVSGTEEGRRTVTTDLIISGAKNGQTLSRRTEAWTFGLVDEDGWRVCSAAKGS